MKNKLLSICIPTYNRAEYLRQCLNSIIVASKEFMHELEIIISDNNSTDSTNTIVFEFIKIYSCIYYYKNDSNIGAEKNIYQVATHACGNYIWIFGDDDRMEKNAIQEVITNLNYGFNLVVCNYSIWDKTFSTLIYKKGLSFNKNLIFYDANKLMKKLGPHLGYISSVIIKKDLFFKLSFNDYSRFLEYGFPFLFAVYFGISVNCKAIYLDKTIILNCSNNSGDYDWYKYFVKGLSLIFKELNIYGFSQKSIKSANHEVIKRYVLKDLLVRKRDKKSLSGLLHLTYQQYKCDWLFWFGILPIFLLPGQMIFILWRVMKLFKS